MVVSVQPTVPPSNEVASRRRSALGCAWPTSRPRCAARRRLRLAAGSDERAVALPVQAVHRAAVPGLRPDAERGRVSRTAICRRRCSSTRWARRSCSRRSLIGLVDAWAWWRSRRPGAPAASPSWLLERLAQSPAPWVAIGALALVWLVRLPLYVAGAWIVLIGACAAAPAADRLRDDPAERPTRLSPRRPRRIVSTLSATSGAK